MPVNPLLAATAILRRPVVTASVLSSQPIAYDPYLPGRRVDLVTGRAECAGPEPAIWTAVVKRTTGVGLRAARRELAAYRDGIAPSVTGAGLRAPTLVAWDEGKDRVELWLEALSDEHGGQWPTARFELAARHIGEWDAHASQHPLPPRFDAEDAWAERHGQPERVPEAIERLDLHCRATTADGLMALLDDPGFRRTGALIASTQARIDRLATFPGGPLHHDLVRSNLFALADGGTAAIDWENVGRGPFGVDLAPLVIGSVRRGEASADDLPAIETTSLDAYVAVVADAGVAGREEIVTAYRLALGLRWHVVLGTIGAWLDPGSTRIRGSRPQEQRAESLRHLVAVSRHILDAGEDADT